MPPIRVDTDGPLESKDPKILELHEQIPGLYWAIRGIYDAPANGRSGQIYAWQARMAAQLTTNELSGEDISWAPILSWW